MILLECGVRRMRILRIIEERLYEKNNYVGKNEL